MFINTLDCAADAAEDHDGHLKKVYLNSGFPVIYASRRMIQRRLIRQEEHETRKKSLRDDTTNYICPQKVGTESQTLSRLRDIARDVFDDDRTRSIEYQFFASNCRVELGTSKIVTRVKSDDASIY